jgi:hypothetical protein
MCNFVQKIGLISLRLTFGGSPCPNKWCVTSVLCTDLANNILHCEEWNPSEINSPHTINLPSPSYLDESIPFAKASNLDVLIPEDDKGRVDDFIDDGFVIVPDIEEN